jgi:8-oxo-dGTP pyrophosphatase MutT (NUDIX family)
MSEQLFQIAIKALIRDKAGKILMVHIPQMGSYPPHWDLPGGRMDPGESFLDTLQREMMEELSVGYQGTPTQLTAFLTNITIPVGDVRYPLAFVVFEVTIADDAKITLDPNSNEDDFAWFAPEEAAKEMAYKLSPEFCELVRALK